MVCTSGVPSTAVVTLLGQLSESGCRLLAHADFDVGGLRIIEQLRMRCAAEPWAMTASHYERYADASSVELRGPVPPTPWNPMLNKTMRAHGRAVFEEQLVDELLAN